MIAQPTSMTILIKLIVQVKKKTKKQIFNQLMKKKMLTGSMSIHF